MRQPRATRWTIRLGLAATTGIAAFASYLHALDVVEAADGRTAVAYLIPALADLVIATASANILDASRRGQSWPPLAKVAAGVGIVVTVAANIMATWPHAVPVWCVNVWPPLAFFLALEQLADHVRRGRVVSEEGSGPAAWGQDEPPSVDEALGMLLAAGSLRGLAAELGVPKSRVETWKARTAALNGSGPHA